MDNRTDKKSGWIIGGGVFVAILVTGLLVIAVREMFIQRDLNDLDQDSGPDLGEIPEGMLAFEELRNSFGTGYEDVRDFSIGGGGRIYVAGDRSVRIFEKNGSESGEILPGGAPTAVTATDEKVYIALGDHLVIYNREGDLLDRWEEPAENSLLTSIEVYGDEVFLADAGSRFVRRYDKRGNDLAQIGSRDTERGVPGIVLSSPFFVVLMGNDGLLRVNNPGRHRIEAYTLDGDLGWSWGKASNAIEGFCGCCNPVDFALLPDGRYVTVEKGLIRVKIYDADGEFESVAAGPEQLVPGSLELLGQRSPDRYPAAFKVETDSEGLIYVLDPRRSRVRFFREKEE